MLDYRPLDEVIRHPGLRLVLVKNRPSPWGQAAKAIFEVKKLEFVVGPQMPGEPNAELEAWSGQTAGPVVAWKDEKPINRWIDILYLAERLAPSPALIPQEPSERALMIGLSHEICGELGIGWNRRLQLFAPAMASGKPPEGVARMGAKYNYNAPDAQVASARTAASLRLLAAQLRRQYERGAHFFVGDALSAVDLYWVAFANTVAPLPPEKCPMPEPLRAAFSTLDVEIASALDPILIEHRDAIFKSCFKDPMEL